MDIGVSVLHASICSNASFSMYADAMDSVHLIVSGACSGGCLQSRLLAGPRPGPCQLLRWPLFIGAEQAAAGIGGAWKSERERERVREGERRPGKKR